ncbi:sulfite exporter TauE/SafE family protein [Salinirubrum litoreum]|uniref:Probable membrane transporter protein n=1 Tax=Salinirubrum litoreum TaxID=1126234 RepID=A0ABD5RBI3_9EURY
MPTTETLLLLAVIGLCSGVVGGIGGPGGIPVIVSLNLLLVLSSPVVAATTSSVFVVATVTATALYRYSDGIEWGLAVLVGVPALLGTQVGTRTAVGLSVARFEQVLAATLLLAVAGIVYRQRTRERDPSESTTGWRRWPIAVLVGVGSLLVGVVAGITGIGGPALTVPLLLVVGIAPITAIGAGLASGVLITVAAALGHAVQGNPPALLPAIVVGVPYVCAQVVGWKYVHVVSERTVAYSIAAVALLGVVGVLL